MSNKDTLSLLPPSEHFQYFSHIFHANNFIPYDQYEPLPDWSYTQIDVERFENLFLQDSKYILDKKILDLGCHTGYFSYVAQHLGARSIHAVNAREFPVDVAKYAFEQLKVKKEYHFDVHDIEDLNFLSQACDNSDTVLLAMTMEHLRNPFAILETISKSRAQHLLLESAVVNEESVPMVYYSFQSKESAFTAFDDSERSIAVGSCPNLAWYENMLYWLGWKIEYFKLERTFLPRFFATPGLEKFKPSTKNVLTVLCTKFTDEKHKDNYEN